MDGTEIEGSIRGPRGPKNRQTESHIQLLSLRGKEKCNNYGISCWDDKQREAVEAEDLCLNPDHLNCL